MKFEPFTPTSCEEEPSAYKPNGERPPDRALLVIHAGRALFLDHIGPGIDHYIFEGLHDEDEYEEPNGVYIWEGELRSERTEHYYGETEIDYVLEGELRLATLEEWQSYVKEQGLWDRDQWLT